MPTISSPMKILLFLLASWAAFAQTAPPILDVRATDIDYAGAQIIAQTVSYAFTVDASTDTINATGHVFTNGNRVKVLRTSGDSLPGGLSASVDYYVRDAATDTFKVSTTSGGSAVNITNAGDGTFKVFYTLASFRVAFAVDPAKLEDGAIEDQTGTRNNDGRYDWFDQTINRAPPSTKMYVRLFLNSDGVLNETWKCQDGSITEGTLTDLACESGVNWPYFTTAALPGPPDVEWPSGTYPKKATGATYTPTTFGSLTEGVNQFTVASDCSDVQIKLASAAGAGQNALVITPFGPSVACNFGDLPAKSADHQVVVQSGAGVLYLPPVGVRIQERHRPYVTRVVGITRTIDSTRNGYTFIGIDFHTAPATPPASTVPLSISTTQQGGNASTWQITTTDPHGFTAAGAIVRLDGVASLNSTCGPGIPIRVSVVLSATTLRFSCVAAVVPGTPDSTAGRYIVPYQSLSIDSLTLGSGSCSGGALVSVPSGSRAAVSNNLVIGIGRAQGVPGLNKSWRVTPVTAETFCLQDSASLAGTYVPGSGVWAVDVPIKNIVRVEIGTEKFWFDRCIFDGDGFPNRILTSLLLLGNNQGVVDSRFVNTAAWLAIDPVPGTYKAYTTNNLSTTPICVDFSSGINKLIKNNYFEGHGILLFSQQGDGLATDHAENILIEDNDLVSPFRYMTGAPEWSDGLYWGQRHFFELKRGRVVTFQRNRMRGGWADNVVVGWCIALTIRGSVPVMPVTSEQNQIADIIIRDNIIESVASGINITNYDDGNPLLYRTKRVALENNVFRDINWLDYRSAPSASGAAKVSNPTGGSGWFVGAAHSATIRNNLVFHPIGSGPRVMQIPRATHYRVLNNVAVHNEFATGGVWSSGAGGDALPAVTDNYMTATRWGNMMRQVNTVSGPDPNSMFRGNVLVRGTQNNLQTATYEGFCMASTTGNCNVTAAEMTSRYGSSGVNFDSPAANSSWSGATPNERIAEVLWSDPFAGNFHLKRNTTTSQISSASSLSYNRISIGPDLNKIERDGLTASNARVLDITSTTAKIAYRSSGACHLQYSTGAVLGSTRVAGPSTGHNPNRIIELSGLSPKTVYNWLLSCPSQEFEGSFRTH